MSSSVHAGHPWGQRAQSENYFGNCTLLPDLSRALQIWNVWDTFHEVLPGSPSSSSPRRVVSIRWEWPNTVIHVFASCQVSILLRRREAHRVWSKLCSCPDAVDCQLLWPLLLSRCRVVSSRCLEIKQSAHRLEIRITVLRIATKGILFVTSWVSKKNSKDMRERSFCSSSFVHDTIRCPCLVVLLLSDIDGIYASEFLRSRLPSIGNSYRPFPIHHFQSANTLEKSATNWSSKRSNRCRTFSSRVVSTSHLFWSFKTDSIVIAVTIRTNISSLFFHFHFIIVISMHVHLSDFSYAVNDPPLWDSILRIYVWYHNFDDRRRYWHMKIFLIYIIFCHDSWQIYPISNLIHLLCARRLHQ